MKRIKFTLLLAVFMSMIGIRALAHDIEVANDDGVTIYYLWNYNKTELNVSFRGTEPSFYDRYTGDITIPESVTYEGNTYPVTGIWNQAFLSCPITSITIPNSVTTIGTWAFRGCSELTSINIPNSVTSIGERAFAGCSGLTSIIFPNSVTSIDGFVFEGCTGLTSPICLPTTFVYLPQSYSGTFDIPNGTTTVCAGAFCDCNNPISITIPSSMTTISNSAFNQCTGLTSITIPNSVTIIGESAFQDCTNLNDVTIPNSVRTIQKSAFADCTGLTNINLPNTIGTIKEGVFAGCTSLTSITIPNSVTSIERYGFYNCSNLTTVNLPSSVTTIRAYAFKGCTSLTDFTLHNDVENIGMEAFDGVSKIYVCDGTVSLVTLWNNRGYEGQILETGTGKRLDVFYVTPTTVNIHKFVPIDGVSIVNETILFDQKDIGNNYIFTGLTPESQHTVWYKITIEAPNGRQFYHTNSGQFRTPALIFNTLQPKVVSSGNVIVAAESNMDDAEENVGFEWRRTDWSDDFQSNTGQAYMYEGTMEGYIRNLNTEKLWKYRPYYLSDAGTYYYGDWVGIDPTNTSYFEPTVHTYAVITVNGNTALVRGYALQGTDNITAQGFMYWKNANGARTDDYAPALAPAVPTDAQTVEADGYVMEASLTGLDYDSKYCYVTFAKTSDGQTYYGEQRTFSTGADPTGIGGIRTENTNGEAVYEVARYNMHGQRINVPERGINIIRMSDGTTRKVVVK